MKIRKGFVSNSSSSSFVCEVCNRTEVGYDLGLDDAGMYECENYHIFCQSHVIDVNLIGDDVDYVSEKSCPICNYVEMSFRDIRQYFSKVTDIKEETVFEEIKKINKRRRKLYDHEYVEYVMKEKGITSDMLLSELKTTYPSYKDFKFFLRSKGW